MNKLAFIIVVAVLNCSVAVTEVAQWDIRDTKIRFCPYLRTPKGDQKDALKGRAILEVRGTYHFTGDGTIKVGEISLELPGTDENPKLLGVGMPAIVAAASYVYPEKAGKNGSSISSTKRGKFMLQEQADGSVTLSLLQNPTQLSLAFDVPKGTADRCVLHFGPLKLPVPDDQHEATNAKTPPEAPDPKAKVARPGKVSAEKTATNRLGMAKQILAANKKAAARRMLKDLVAKYPDTDAADRARSLLTELEK